MTEQSHVQRTTTVPRGLLLAASSFLSVAAALAHRGLLEKQQHRVIQGSLGRRFFWCLAAEVLHSGPCL
jgi:hypothetical protein